MTSHFMSFMVCMLSLIFDKWNRLLLLMIQFQSEIIGVFILLWVLMFLKLCAFEHDLCANAGDLSSVTDSNTLPKWVWHFIFHLGPYRTRAQHCVSMFLCSLQERIILCSSYFFYQILFENRYKNDNGVTASSVLMRQIFTSLSMSTHQNSKLVVSATRE